MGLFETVPNISEGRRAHVVDECALALERNGAKIINRTSDPIHNRSVLTAVGEYEQLLKAAPALAAVALRLIDLRDHEGVHPRIGALDVLPFVPLEGSTMSQAISLAKESARLIWDRLAVPSFLYGEAAATPARRNLAAIRNGQFEGLEVRFERPDWKPDFGNVHAHVTAGAIAVGARDVLVAFNVELGTGNLAAALRIARAVRESTGGLKSLKALAFRLSPALVQVSLNVTDYRATPLYRVFERVAAVAARECIEVVRSELIGCLPARAVADCAEYYLGLPPSMMKGALS
ncbi:MAG: glutamate formimidoyltransferase [Vulcanimicrobiaceae bacterium]